MNTITNPETSSVLIAGFIETSFIEWEGKITSVIFLSGCNFRCPWCQNSKLVLKEPAEVPFEEIKKKISKFKNWIDGITITGGEPLINPSLTEIILWAKENSFKVKIDTNGSKPDILEMFIKDGLVDYVAMDIKTSLDKDRYKKACGVDVNLKDINRSIEILMNSKIDYEFRTTAVPLIVTKEDVRLILKRIPDDKKYSIQKFVPHETLDPEYMNIKPYSDTEIDDMNASVMRMHGRKDEEYVF